MGVDFLRFLNFGFFRMPIVVPQTRLAESSRKSSEISFSSMRLFIWNSFISALMRFSSPILTGRILNLSNNFWSFSLSRTLSIATCVLPQSNIRLPCFMIWHISSKMTVVFPEPGGPSRIAKSGVFKALLTKLLCSLHPLRLSSVNTSQFVMKLFSGYCQRVCNLSLKSLMRFTCSLTGWFLSVLIASSCFSSWYVLTFTVNFEPSLPWPPSGKQ